MKIQCIRIPDVPQPMITAVGAVRKYSLQNTLVLLRFASSSLDDLLAMIDCESNIVSHMPVKKMYTQAVFGSDAVVGQVKPGSVWLNGVTGNKVCFTKDILPIGGKLVDGWTWVCDTPHADGDYKYTCNVDGCKCKKGKS